VLEHGVDVALERRQRGDGDAGHEDVARRRRLESRDHPERRRLARAGRAQQGEKLTGRDLERQIVHRGKVSEPLGEPAQLEDRHGERLMPAGELVEVERGVGVCHGSGAVSGKREAGVESP
jgi:hypothetical protein